MWIGIIAFALIGIVTLQLGLLKLNSGIGRALEREAGLQRANASLSIENSELASGTRVETEAERLGMRVSGVSSLHFLSSHPRGDAARAATVLRKPLTPASEPPGGSETPATGSEEVASSTAGETTGSAGSTSTQESSNQPSGGSEAAATGTTQEAPSQSAAGESGAASAPSPAAAPATGATGASGPAGGEPHSEAGGGTEAPGG
jgi:hypothetical protein